MLSGSDAPATVTKQSIYDQNHLAREAMILERCRLVTLNCLAGFSFECIDLTEILV